ncbi:HlyD family type I secretion periplasmic adaptor subunit [Uliginosibacterium sp. H1]|uniref:HlyD family type I secretion periplasmic adaptor subunit n=1 Tax=Uliginosibacterium sp. H1 TaxID=3114757 RepID=UPI002E19FB15|nr:HlyD family type I secretion periplasmic adaptor subunit [Uliginosibacterium sp. H1]
MAADYLQQLQRAWRARQVVWLVSALVVCGLVWAALARVDEVVIGEGKLVPPSSVQKVQGLDGGILRALHVREGDRVSVGQLLVTLDETRARAGHAESLAEQDSLQAMRRRLVAELGAIAGGNVASTRPELPAAEMATFQADMAELSQRADKAGENVVQQQRELAESEKNIQTLQDSLSLLDEELRLTSGAVSSGALGAAELRKIERERVRVAGQVAAEKIKASKLQSAVVESRQAQRLVFDEFRRDAQNKLAEAEAKLARVEQVTVGHASQLEQTRLMASMAGTVKSIALPSIGGVVRPGETIMEIVPSSDALLLESRIAPKDVGRLRIGQSAIVKFSAYDFVIFGGLRGRLVHLSPDALVDEKGNSYFLAHVSAEADELDSRPRTAGQPVTWRERPLIPGMQAQIDILAGKRSVLDYWLKPLLRARANAMREP